MREVYLAGPITGLTHSRAAGWRDDPLLHHFLKEVGWKGLSPLEDYTPAPYHVGPLTAWFEGPEEASTATLNDLSLIRRSDALLVNLDDGAPDRVSIGTMCELGFAYALHKPCVTVCSGVNELYDHPFVVELSRAIVPNLGDAIAELGRLGTVEPAYA